MTRLQEATHVVLLVAIAWAMFNERLISAIIIALVLIAHTVRVMGGLILKQMQETNRLNNKPLAIMVNGAAAAGAAAGAARFDRGARR